MASAPVASGPGRPPSRGSERAAGGPRRLWPQLAATALVLPWLLWLGAYFWFNSSPGQDLLLGAVVGVAPDRVEVGHARWGPLPDEIELIDARVLDLDGRPIIAAEHVIADVSMADLVAGDLFIDRVRVDGFTLHLAWDDEGALNLTRALRRPGAPRPPDDRPRPPPSTRRVTLDRVELARGDVTLEWPRWGLQFQGVDARGAIRVGGAPDDPIAIYADLTGGHAHGMWSDGERTVNVERVGITGFRWGRGGFDVERLELAAADGGLVDVDGRLEVSPALALDVRGDLQVSAAIAAIVDADLLPAGVRVEGLRFAYGVDAPITARAALLSAPELSAGPIAVRDARLTLDALSFLPGGLRPTGSVQVSAAYAGHIEAPDGLSGRGVSIAAIDATIKNESIATLAGIRAELFTLPGGEVGPAAADAEITFGLTAGTFDGKLTTGQGVAAVSGTARLSALTRRFTVAVRVALEGAGGAMAQTLFDLLPSGEAARLTPPIDGFALFETRIARESVEGHSGKRWIARTAITEARLDGGQRVTFDGDGWSVTALEAAPPP